MDYKILLIENQYLQFLKIKKQLNNLGNTVYPEDENSYKEFTDLVRIYLNPRYGGIEDGSKRKSVFEIIAKRIKDGDFDVLIIDYILVGCSAGLNGIFLAEKLREIKKGTPIIFLSRESPDQPEIKDKLDERFNPFEWIPKGYDGREIFEEKYFEKNVIKGIEKCIGKEVAELLCEIKNSAKFLTFRSRIEDLMDKSFSSAQKNRIKEFVGELPTRITSELETLLKLLENENKQGK